MTSRNNPVFIQDRSTANMRPVAPIIVLKRDLMRKLIFLGIVTVDHTLLYCCLPRLVGYLKKLIIDWFLERVMYYTYPRWWQRWRMLRKVLISFWTMLDNHLCSTLYTNRNQCIFFLFRFSILLPYSSQFAIPPSQFHYAIIANKTFSAEFTWSVLLVD